MIKHVIFDCDNTLGIAGCDVDDGLTLLYLLGCPECRLVGLTTTYGNNTIDNVYANTRSMLNTIARSSLPVKRGGACKGDYRSEAVDFLVDSVRAHAQRGEPISLLATGSLTNLMGAYLQDNRFFTFIKEIVLMGGITAPLVFEKKQMAELNFSCDPEATVTVLTKGRNVSVITGNNCLKVLFTREDYQKALYQDEKRVVRFIKDNTSYWFDDNDCNYGIKGFYNWDVTAGVYLMHPELFIQKQYSLHITEHDVTSGFLRQCSPAEQNCCLMLPEIGEAQAFKNAIYHGWLNADW